MDFEPLEVAVLSHAIEYGEEVSSLPTLTPFALNCTPTTPTVSDAFAESVTDEPEMVAPFDGAVIETVGGLLSTVIVMTEEVA
jgi:hypothetical protein